MDRRARITIVSAIGTAVLFILIISSIRSQSVTESQFIPSITANSEIAYYGHKYANYSNIIISVKKEISCEWKPDVIDDGWKNCEAVFDVENLNNIKPVISVPNLNFSFKNFTLRNIVINFSNISVLYNETFINRTRQAINITNGDGNNITIINTTETIIQFARRSYSNFTSVPLSINTSIPFAVKISFELPKYQQNSFNFTINRTGFSGFIDPDVSACGTLGVANSVYTLIQDVSSSGTCFTITADNITFNGNNSVINYNTGGSSGFYGIYIFQANNTFIKNFKDINLSSFPVSDSYAVYFLRARNGTLFNNSVTTRGNSSHIIVLTQSPNSRIEGNILRYRTGAVECEGECPVPLASYGILLNSNSHNVSIISNDLLTEGDSTNGNGFYSIGILNLNITKNNLTIGLSSDIQNEGIFLSAGTNSSIIYSNNIYEKSTNADGIFLSNSHYNNITSNNVTSDLGIGINLVSTDSNNIIFNNNITTASTSGHGIIIDTNSITNNISSNNITLTGGTTDGIRVTGAGNKYNIIENNFILARASSSVGIRISGSNNNTYTGNIINMLNINSPGLLFTGSSTNNTIRNIYILTNGSGSNATSLSNTIKEAHNFTIVDSYLNSTNAFDFSVGRLIDGGEWNLTNVTGKSSVLNVSWNTGGNGTLNLHWYLDAFANYTNGSVASNANISSWNVNNLYQFSQLTGANGRITRQTLLEYKRNETSGTNYTYYSNYTVNATSPNGAENLTQSWNMTTNRDLVFTFLVSPNINSCQILGQANTVYYLTQNVSSNGTCFTITANNITLDGNISKITYGINGTGGQYGIYVTGYNKTTLKNLRIEEGNNSGSVKHAIYFINVNNATIYNNTIRTNTTSSYGIIIEEDGSFNNISNNNISISGTGASGIFWEVGGNQFVSGNIINTSGLNSPSIQFGGSSSNIIIDNNIYSNGTGFVFDGNNNKFNNNTLIITGGNGIQLNGGNNNTLSNFSIVASYVSSHGILFGNTNNNATFYNGRINASHPSSNDTQFGATSSGILNFTNVTLANNKIGFASGSTARLNVHWYVDALANYPNGSFAGNTNITGYNVSKSIAFSQLTGSNGRIARQTVLSYWRNATVFSDQNNYTFNATLVDGSQNLSQSWNISTNRDLLFTFSDIYPVITINSPANNSIESIPDAILNWSVQDDSNSNEIFVWASNTSTNLGNEVGDYLVYHRKSQANGTYTYNFTAVPTVNGNDIVLLLHFDNLSSYGENATFARDFGNNATCTGSACPSFNETGFFAGAFEYDGVNDSMKITNSQSINLSSESFTYAFWFYSRSGGTQDIIAKHPGTAATTGSGYRVLISSVAATGFSAVVANGTDNYRGDSGTNNCRAGNIWCHLAVTVNRTNSIMTMYINGVVVNSTPIMTSGPVGNTLDLYVGSNSSGTSRFFNGTLDELVIWNRSLAASEITELYNLTLGRFYYWKVNATDSAGNTNTSGIYQFNLTIQVFKRNIANILSLSSLGGKAGGFLRISSQLIDVNDAFTKAIYVLRVIAQLADINDAVFRVFKALRGISQLADVNDAVFRIIAGLRNIVQVTDISDTTFKVFVGLRNIVQVTDINDAIARFISIPRAISQIVDINDTVFRILAGFRNVAQTANINDSVARLFSGFRNAAQLLDINDAVFRVYGALRASTLNLDINDNVIKAFRGFRVI
ncbi:hypothetical protein HYV49_03175, partial [Candidatus Pacearchaeota archaeon]|nr:hypothetical protein [Candidatus Pacearchaeota archaeon]